MKKQKVTIKQITEYTEKYLNSVESMYGESNHHDHTPYVYICKDKIKEDTKGEYCFLLNEITVYLNNIHSHEELIRVLIHEYQHYLQSPSWFTRYYNMGYRYDNHPYEIQAYNEEENWKKIWDKAS
jgi:Zn-dependent peptidase ImmA (M78 family)